MSMQDPIADMLTRIRNGQVSAKTNCHKLWQVWVSQLFLHLKV